MNYQKLNEILYKSSQGLLNINVADTEKTLRLIMKDFNIQELVDSIIKNKTYAKELSTLSYTHKLGFDKIIIAPYGHCSYQLRFNIWWPNSFQESNNYEDIHNHRWDFSTVLLSGAYNYENYRIDETGIMMYHYHYFPLMKGKNSLEFVGKDKIKVFSSGSLIKGELMSASHDILHRVMPIQTTYPTSTLFLTTKPKIKKVSVFKQNLAIGSTEHTSNSTMSVEEFEEKLFQLSNFIN